MRPSQTVWSCATELHESSRWCGTASQYPLTMGTTALCRNMARITASCRSGSEARNCGNMDSSVSATRSKNPSDTSASASSVTPRVTTTRSKPGYSSVSKGPSRWYRSAGTTPEAVARAQPAKDGSSHPAVLSTMLKGFGPRIDAAAPHDSAAPSAAARIADARWPMAVVSPRGADQEGDRGAVDCWDAPTGGGTWAPRSVSKPGRSDPARRKTATLAVKHRA
mmetsp:Transcript_6579/g.27081  ORF Transcript_6579/g.27081 Transcript_6579/m.27081 type:complete len:223 (-) Transcript_6579:570-1238(-)